MRTGTAQTLSQNVRGRACSLAGGRAALLATPPAAALSRPPRTPARRLSRRHLRSHIATLRLRANGGSARSICSSTFLAVPTGARRRSLRLAHRRVARCCRWASRRCARFGLSACIRRVHPTLAHPSSSCGRGGGSRCGLKSGCGAGGVNMLKSGVTSAAPSLPGVVLHMSTTTSFPALADSVTTRGHTVQQ